ncbi:MAG: hemolysin [Ignavibacteria bacterium RIFOXYB2_FULL_35_12]|nr:MAG: hemolysin [Ignavibacteria bacterium GWA2_36_19]OGU56646.1 MAG: hemolysin [Ignavibacteria bacterium GWF2_35_20]OGU81826.1 MAG: hemolysin [Ignavibacteria bacterium RIFOXYA2_FULL_35_9]OGU86369.1 MAG: hemolysin [Ignavibacteria bacterium RIFOXYA12_FULL_35_25]OGU87785.1 MAG: hemolysin [Ignavibacteria bacterium RIFOXYC12_FULL_35_11]OGU96361.1 MAG: hemolysin [Ignavibacteria bacterium RIFOXYB12_FULL_35_14]OGV01529.1 MAG: hemolysin [Ignavibacteria bacterium RIFOXYC2_FULL_35_16]OGV04233.1 MAG: 
MINDLLILIILLALSAFFSASEIAFILSNKIKLEIKARKKNFAAQNALYFNQHPQNFFSTMLIGNNIGNIAFASISAVLLSTLFNLDEFAILIISTIVLLFIGELIPKYLAREIADRFILLSSIPLRVVSFILYPFVKFISWISSFLTQLTPSSEIGINSLFNRETIDSLVRESREAGIVDQKESDIINKVLNLADQRVYEAMRPRTEIVGVEINQTIDEALSIFIDSGYSKLPVYEDSVDNIKGVIYSYDIFKVPENVQAITRKILFVPETKKSFEMLNEFLSNQITIAVVVDEFGGTAGLVTMEDIIEELFGEIRDEYDVEENICRKIAEKSFLISGKVEIDFINEKYNLKLPTGDYETIAGYIITSLGRIPIQGENVKIDHFNFLIARASNKTVEVVKIVVESDHE